MVLFLAPTLGALVTPALDVPVSFDVFVPVKNRLDDLVPFFHLGIGSDILASRGY